jgi:M6 family metalloprotease-like protein
LDIAMSRLILILMFTSQPVVAMGAAESIEAAPVPRKWIDLSGYRSPAAAVKADPKSFPPAGLIPTPLGFLGIAFADGAGKPIIDDVDPDSPAARAGIRVGDRLVAIDGAGLTTAAAAREKLRGRFAGETVRLLMDRGGEATEKTLKFQAISVPMNATADRRVVLGIRIGGVEITDVTAGGGAAAAKVLAGDILIKCNGQAITTDVSLQDTLRDKKPGDMVELVLERAKKELTVSAKLGLAATGPLSLGWDDRLPTRFAKSKYRLAIIGVEYPDVKRTESITGKDWENALFSIGSYTGKNASGNSVYGSMADYYREISHGKMTVEGSFIDWVEVAKKKMDYNLGMSTTSNDKSKYFVEMMDKLIAKKGKDVLKDYDGIFVVFAGDGVSTSRGGLYWPHRARFTHAGKSISYFIVPEARRGKMTDISVICHEFGHMLGLPDLYARPENPGSEGVGVWDAMSNQLPNGRPQHFGAWSKEQMGWLTPVTIDPRVKQKLILGPVSTAATECFKIPVRPDGSEYFLLENRVRSGFDKDLPAEGLLIWRVLPGSRGTQQVYLEEAHGVDGPTGPRVFTSMVPFPSAANRSFTPFTSPSSKSQLGGGFDVSISNIRRLHDGRITFHIGYDYQ